MLKQIITKFLSHLLLIILKFIVILLSLTWSMEDTYFIVRGKISNTIRGLSFSSSLLLHLGVRVDSLFPKSRKVTNPLSEFTRPIHFLRIFWNYMSLTNRGSWELDLRPFGPKPKPFSSELSLHWQVFNNSILHIS